MPFAKMFILKLNLNCNRHEESFKWIDACTDPKNVTVIHHVNETEQHLYHKAKIKQAKMLITCQRFADLFLFGLAVVFSSDKI